MRTLTDHQSMPVVYRELLRSLLDSEYSEINERTGVLIKTLFGGYSFKLDLSNDRVPVVGSRKLFPRSAAAEIAWFLSGSNDVTWLEKYSGIWSKFTEDDGKTVSSAYGNRWRSYFGRDQVADAVEALKANSTDRRVYVSAWDPAEDGLGRPSKNVPCPLGFTLSIAGGALHSTVTLRSSDVFVGLPYDVMGHAMLMQVLATTLDVNVGTMTVTLAHPHLYEPHFEMARTCVDAPLPARFTLGPRLQPFDLENVERFPDEFVAAYVDEAKECSWPEFSPRPELVL